jgi:SAM-dependent methyltransferase
MSTPRSHRIDRCRLCQSPALETLLDLGCQPPANSLRTTLSAELPKVPLVLCRCRTCGVAQLTDTIAPEFLFKSYVWVTGTSRGAQSYSQSFCDELFKRAGHGARSAIEVASNDGTFLKPFAARGLRVLGIDPAHNISERATASGIPTIAEFFGKDCASTIVATHGKADIVFARNVLPHVPQPGDVVAGIAACLAEDGVGAIEFHRADIIVRELQYDSIYHEHFFYYTLRDIEGVLNRAGLKVFDIMESPISGGSWVVFFSHQHRQRTDKLSSARREEDALQLHDATGWHVFAQRCAAHRDRFVRLLRTSRATGVRIVGYGASARSATLLNYCGIGPSDLDGVADKSHHKHGKFTPGSDLLIDAPETVFATKPHRVVLLAWNFKDEILEDMEQNLGWKGPVLLPLPGDAQWMREQ